MRRIYRFLIFTGSIPFLVLLGLFLMHPTKEWSYIFTIPIFLAFVFSVFWTEKNIYKNAKVYVVGPKTKGNFSGVYFGMYQRSKFVRDFFGKWWSEDGHILVVGGAGSGKTSGIVIHTLKYFWEPAFLAVDIKGELSAKSGRTAYIFNPSNPDSFGYDPFYFAKNSDNPSAHIREIAINLVPESPDIKDPFWIRAAQNILTGHLLAGYYDNATFVELLKGMQSYPAETLIDIACENNSEAAMFVSQYRKLKAETLAGIMAELSNHIVPLIGDRDIERCLSKKDVITPSFLEAGRNIFLQIPEHRINQYGPLVSLIIQQFLSFFEQRDERTATPILFMVDEFARLNKIEAIVHGLATLRSKRITICLIIQSLAQLDSIYGQEQRRIITDNCSYKAVLRATDADTQDYFSRLVGTHEVSHISVQKERGLFFDSAKGYSESTKEVRVIRPEEFAYLDFAYLDKELVVFTPLGSGKIEKVQWFSMKGQTQLP